MNLETIIHPFEPVFDSNSKVLILGTMPCLVSRKNNFYYANPHNRFWQVLSAVFDESLPYTVEDKKQFVLKHGIALWDILQSCEMSGADETTIKKPVANDLTKILTGSNIKIIYVVGDKAFKFYKKYCQKQTLIPAIKLPSTSTANQGRFPLNVLIDKYMVLKTGRPAEYTL
ncbi:MAG: DNA-deoxyinosine glycosylase [Treponema sp.]|nr:DNA-deoxyinosine glycosylase [Treponema sp.]